MTKVLPLSLQKNLNGYLLYAYPYCILDSYPNGRAWIMDHYFQACSYINEDEDINLEILDGISYGKFYMPYDVMKVKFYRDTEDIIAHVISAINNNEFVVVFIDEYQRGTHGRPFLHEILLYGYEKDQFAYIAFDKNMVFKEMRITSDNLKCAFEQGKEAPSTKAADWASYRRIINLSLNDRCYSSDKYVINTRFNQYVSGGTSEIMATDEKQTMYCMYQGIDNTKLFLNVIDRYSDNYFEHIPYAGIHLLSETKQLIQKRILSYGLLTDPQKYGEVVSCFEIARMCALKNVISGKRNVKKVYDALSDGYKKECELLRKSL